MEKKKISKLEIALWVGVILIAGILLGVYLMTAKQGDFVQVRVSGTVTEVYPLSEDGTYTITGKGKNILVIQDGKAYIREADCPDKLCVKQGTVSRVGQSLICLPNEVVVEVVQKQKQDSDVDAVVK